MQYRLFVFVLLSAVVVAGCQSDTAGDAPPEIRYGEDTCEQCRMIISEPRFASAYVTRQGEARRFDGIGEMLLFHAKHAEDVATFWVHDYNTTEWLKADQTFFVISQELHTPMGHGIVAVRTKNRAAELAAQVQGVVVQFAELLSRFPLDTTASTYRPQHGHMPQPKQAVTVEKTR